MKRLQTRLVIEMINSSELPSNLTFKQHQQYSGHVQISNIMYNFKFDKHLKSYRRQWLPGHNRGKIEALLKSTIGKFKSMIGSSQEPIESNDKGACNCVLRNVDGKIQTWHPILFLVSLHIAMYG